MQPGAGGGEGGTARDAGSAVDHPTDGADALGEARQHGRLKGSASAVLNHPNSLPQRVGWFVNPGVEQGVKGVRQPHHLHPGGNVLPGQLIRVAGAIPPLVVVAADVTDQGKGLALFERRNAFQETATSDGVGFHHFKLIPSEAPWFVENLRGDGLLPNIMERGQNGVKLYLPGRQCGDGASSGKRAQQAGGKAPELGAVGSKGREKPLPAQERQRGFNVQFDSPHSLIGLSGVERACALAAVGGGVDVERLKNFGLCCGGS